MTRRAAANVSAAVPTAPTNLRLSMLLPVLLTVSLSPPRSSSLLFTPSDVLQRCALAERLLLRRCELAELCGGEKASHPANANSRESFITEAIDCCYRQDRLPSLPRALQEGARLTHGGCVRRNVGRN